MLMLYHLKKKTKKNSIYVSISVLFRIKNIDYTYVYKNVKVQDAFLRNLDLVFGSQPFKYTFQVSKAKFFLKSPLKNELNDVQDDHISKISYFDQILGLGKMSQYWRVFKKICPKIGSWQKNCFQLFIKYIFRKLQKVSYVLHARVNLKLQFSPLD